MNFKNINGSLSFMRAVILTFLFGVIFAYFTLYDPTLKSADAQIPQKDCSRVSIGISPLNDLSASEDYLGEEGGLYGNGMNFLSGHDPHQVQAHRATQNTRPRDQDGFIDEFDGKIGFVSIGMSNTRFEFDNFQGIAEEHKSDVVVIVNGAQPGMVASLWANPELNNDPWAFLADALNDAGLTPAQVQVVWLKQANAAPQPGTDDFPIYAQQLRDDLGLIVKRIKDFYPNVQLVYLSSRIYAGYSQGPLNPEPFAYESAFSVRWLIEDQRMGGGTTGINYENAPVLLWGPYLWADGTVPRSDGLVWNCEDLADDGVHPSESGRQKVADMLLNFFTTDSLAKVWFLPKQFIYLPAVQSSK